MSGAIAIVALRGFATVQDGGRRGHMHEGVPPGGARVPELLARANAALGNAWDAPAIELHGALGIEARGANVLIATEDGVVRAVTTDERTDITGARYVAVAGGIDTPRVLGGRGALVAAGIGAWLRIGDLLRAGEEATAALRWLAPLDDDSPIRIVAGPDVARFHGAALSTLLAATFVVSPISDRVGTRLAGPPLARRDDDVAASMPMVEGAIQVPASGEAIVLGPDHPTTGGYPVLAVVARVDRGRLAEHETGAEVRFRAVTVDDARRAWRARTAWRAHSFQARNDVP